MRAPLMPQTCAGYAHTRPPPARTQRVYPPGNAARARFGVGRGGRGPALWQCQRQHAGSRRLRCDAAGVGRVPRQHAKGACAGWRGYRERHDTKLDSTATPHVKDARATLDSATLDNAATHTTQDIGSGDSYVHNTLLFDHPEKSLCAGPWTYSPQPLWSVFQIGLGSAIPPAMRYITNQHRPLVAIFYLLQVGAGNVAGDCININSKTGSVSCRLQMGLF